jgi:hypothetical protein
MLYREIIAVSSQIHTKHINTLCGRNVELLNIKLVVHIVTTGLRRVQEQHVTIYKVFIRAQSPVCGGEFDQQSEVASQKDLLP